ncbi:hypothetical protein [Nocardia tengchongensis]
MHSEHEEAMRWEFRDCIAMSWKALRPGVTGTEAEEIACGIAEYDQRWQSGPHAREWNFLCAAYSDWREQPENMRKLAEDLRINPTVYADGGMTEVQRRSLDQARNIAHEERCAVEAFTTPTQRTPIQRER